MTLTDVSKTFTVVAGSVVGREHVRLRKNNQDAAAFTVSSEMLVAVVADGCSAGRASEVGARLGAEWMAANAPRLIKKLRGGTPELAAEMLVRALLRYLSAVASGLGVAALEEMFLFTIWTAIVERERGFVFGIGDGGVSINGDWISSCEPAPPYAAYRLFDADQLEEALPPGALSPVVRWSGPAREIESLILGTDGAAALEADVFAEVASDRAYTANPSLLHKKLAAVSDAGRRLFDDTTLVLIRREVAP